MRKLFRKNLITICCVFLVISCSFFFGCEEPDPDHVHEYVKTQISATCQEKGYTLNKCSCEDEFKSDEVDALGHDFTEFVSNNDATFESDGTKTRTCKREGCGVSETVTDEGSKLVAIEPSITFRSLSTTDVNEFQNSVFSFCFKNEIIVTGGATYSVYKDQEKTQSVNLNNTYLAEGTNVYYVFANVGGIEKTFTITIYREESVPETPPIVGPSSTPVTVPLSWNTYNSTLAPITTAISTKLNIGSYTASNINKYRIVYTSNQPLKGLITIGTHTEDFFLEAGENVTFTSFTDDVLGDRESLNLAKWNVHNTPFVAGNPVEEKVVGGKKFSGEVSIYVEPIEDVTATFKLTSFSTAYQEIEDKVVYMVNDRFRIGTHLYYGGSLTYFEDLNDGRDDIGNLINIHDGGRLVQQSYYATDVAANGGVSYNPVQGGNGAGYSKLIDLEITEDYIYIKARAKSWLDRTNNGLSSSYMENWYSIEEDYVRVENTFVDFLLANNNDIPHELPAVYLVGGLKNLAFYTGNSPWTDDALSYWDAENLMLGVGGKGHQWYHEDPESWACWFNEEGWGVGFYVPNTDGCQAWAAGNADNMETYNPYANETTYFRLSQGYPIRPFEKVEYSYIIATGTPNEIRQTFKENKNYDVNEFPESYADTYDLTNIDFSNPLTMGFVKLCYNCGVYYDEQRECARIVSTTNDPYFSILINAAEERPLADDYPIIAVEYMILERFSDIYSESLAQIYLGVGNQSGVTGSQVKSFQVIADGNWQIGYVELSDCAWYTGTVNVIRFDPTSKPVDGTEMYLKSIKLLQTAPTNTSYEDDYTPTAKTWAENKNEAGGYKVSIDSAVSDGNFTTVVGWFLMNCGAARFDYLIFEDGSVTDSYLYSAEAENYWMPAQVINRGERLDASKAYPDVGDDGSNAGFTIIIPERLTKDGKTYKFALRIIANNGKACYVKILDFPTPTT